MIDDAWEAFCLDEACDYIVRRVRDGDKIIWEVKGEDNAPVSLHDFYSRIGVM